MSKFIYSLTSYVSESRFEGTKMSIKDFIIYYREIRKEPYTVSVEYYGEGDSHVCKTLKEAKKCYRKYCRYGNTIVTLSGPGVHISNGKEYLRG